MTSPMDHTITELIPVRLIWDAGLGSPPELQGYGGILVSVPPEAIPLPSTGSLFGLRGYARQAVGAVPWEWVLQGDVDPVDTFVDQLTGRPGWILADARAGLKTMLMQLFSAGIPRATLAARFPELFNAIKAEILAEVAAQPHLTKEEK
jgi:hypothetical protein